MIQSRDRSGWFGASDTHFIMGNWDTKTFRAWWMEKLGLAYSGFQNRYTAAGTHYEHKILDALGLSIRKDHQIKIRRLRLRVNLDGDTPDCIYEVKTHRAEKSFRITPAYMGQIQVEMFAKRCAKAFFVAYALLGDDYTNYFNPIDPDRLELIPAEYDGDWLENQYLPRLRYLAGCLKKGVWPDELTPKEMQYMRRSGRIY